MINSEALSMTTLPQPFDLSKELAHSQKMGAPIVALESAVITHGLPRPTNHELASHLEADIQAEGATPATIALLDGRVKVGLEPDELARLAALENTRKISPRDFGIALANGLSGGTTVAATLHVAHQAGIRVFATGGIGGVHRGSTFDVSADLPQLGKTPVVVVCAGAKSILDLPATREVLETQGVPVIGYQTDDFPAFYTRSSGLPVDYRVDTPEAAAAIATQSWDAGIRSAVLLVVPPPEETALPEAQMEEAVVAAIAEAEALGIHGAATTPFLLGRMSEITKGESLTANLALLRNNAKVAAQVAVAMAAMKKPPSI
jgi:pseudouridine-5'-phosphate glycosidase